MHYRWLTLLLLVCLGLPGPARAQTTLTVIDMHNAPPEQVIPLLEPLLLPGESARAFRNQLVVDVSPGSLQRIRELLREVDRPLHNLLIEVDEGLDTESASQTVEASGHVSVRDGDAHGRAGLRLEQHQTRRDSQLNQQLRAVEGYPAFVALSRDEPVTVHNRHGEHRVAQTRTQGFFVVARLQGSRVFLDIHTSHDHPDDARRQTAATTVSGNLGDWIPIAGLEQRSDAASTGLASSSGQQIRQSGSVRLRVRLAD